MLDYGPYWVYYRLKKRLADLMYLIGKITYLENRINAFDGQPTLLLRDAPAEPEPAPTVTSKVNFLSFRDKSPSKTWDPDAQTWI